MSDETPRPCEHGVKPYSFCESCDEVIGSVPASSVFDQLSDEMVGQLFGQMVGQSIIGILAEVNASTRALTLRALERQRDELHRAGALVDSVQTDMLRIAIATFWRSNPAKTEART